MQARRTGEPPREQSRAPRVEIGLARKREVERLEGPRRPQEQRRGFTPAAFGIRRLGTEQVETGVLELIEGSGLGRGEQSARRIERTRLEARLDGCQGSAGPTRRVTRQRNRALQERGRGRQSAPRARSVRRALEVLGDLLIQSGRRCGPMPGTAIGVGRRRRSRPPTPGGRRVDRGPWPSGTPRSAPGDGGT